MEEKDPYAQHGEVPEVGYIDPPKEPYRYISPVKRDNIYSRNLKTFGIVDEVSPIPNDKGKKDKKLSSNKLCECGKALRTTCDAGSQTVLSMEQIEAALAALEGGSSPAPKRSNSSSGPSKRVSASVTSRRPSEPVRSSSSKKAPTITSPASVSSLAPRALKSTAPSSKVTASLAANDAVVAAPRSTRAGIGSHSSVKVSQDATTTPPPSKTSVLTPQQQQLLLDVNAGAARKMFSGSGNNGVGTTRSVSSGKTPVAPNNNLASPANLSLKRGKSSERPAACVSLVGAGGAALQAALARNLLRKQAALTKPVDQFSHQSSSTGGPVKKVQGEFVTAAEPSPIRPTNTLAANLPQSLSSPLNSSLARPAGGPGGRAPSSVPQTISLMSTLAPSGKFSRVPSSGSQGDKVAASAPTLTRRHAGAPSTVSAESSVTSHPNTDTKRTTAMGGVTPPTRLVSSSAKPTARGMVKASASTSSLHIDPVVDTQTEVKKAQGINQQIVHQQAAVDDREKAREWQKVVDGKQ